MTAHLHPSPEHFAPARTLTVGHSAFTATSGQPSPHTLHFAPVPKDYAAALQVADSLGQAVKLAEARTRAAHEATFPATVAYLQALDAYEGTRSDRPASVQRDLDDAMRDLRECVARGQAEELHLENAQAEHQKAARLAEALL